MVGAGPFSELVTNILAPSYDFQLADGCSGQTLAVDNHCTISVTMDTTTPSGPVNAYLIIGTPNAGELAVWLSGTVG